ncbi:DUF2865 domain-containing protein [Mesorhizobium sp. LHD-90]|uniref:DUF2865 domain-containing protein n=1 Tax=Mesorhizobium sp. LHD-90 TaxID=3071414 RepID=UPI0027E21410|nr:DUF2865 domain-containing protein [Mesorhizobium sp. LHD-90]MDQ6437749.1 DUF2865 domain-containing protein [Mesorhizobium sp. LHD-90]
MKGFGIGLGGAAIVAAAILLVSTPALEAQGATRICRQLEAELASGGGGSARAGRYDAAIAKQREQMAIARAQAEDAGCGFALLGRAVRQCAALNATIDRMVRNLDKLQRQRDRIGGGRSRARLLAALEANGCRDEQPTEMPREAMADPDPDETPKTPLEMMLEEGDVEEYPPLQARVGETYQTMCVRTCDGYFFPISYGSAIGDFSRDLTNCETSCPGTEMQVFFGPSGVDEPAQMVSTQSGRRYSDLPTAFQHQQADVPQPPGCGCNPKKDFSVIAGAKPASRPRVWPPEPPAEPAATDQDAAQDGAIAGGRPVAPVPAQRPDVEGADVAATAPAGETPPFEIAPTEVPRSSIVKIPLPEAAQPKPDPEAAAPASPATAKSSKPEDPAGRKVRVVGPKFLPDPEPAAGSPDPGPEEAR